MNFGYDCRNSMDNCSFEPICNETGELSYVQKYNNILDRFISQFVNSHLLREQIEEDYQKIIEKMDNDHPFQSRVTFYNDNERA